MKFIDLQKQQDIIKHKLDRNIYKVLNHGQYIMGPEVFQLEQELSEYVNTEYCISCSSGTDALLIPLIAKNIGPGDAVLTTTFSYIATAEVIRLVGATPIFIDIDPDTYNIETKNIINAFKIAKEKDLIPRAIIPVDLFGLPANYKKISIISKELGLFIIEDAAQSFGSSINDSKACSFGDVASTSFFPAKPLGCYGDGGAIFTKNNELYEIMKSIRIHGTGGDKYDNVRLGINGRLDTIQAAILLAKLSIFNNEIISRNKIANFYSEHLSEKYKIPHIPSGYTSSWAQYSIITKSELNRTKIIEKLTKNNIPSMIYYKIPLHLQKVFSDLGYKEGQFPISERISKTILSLPMHPYLDKIEQKKIIEVLQSCE